MSAKADPWPELTALSTSDHHLTHEIIARHRVIAEAIDVTLEALLQATTYIPNAPVPIDTVRWAIPYAAHMIATLTRSRQLLFSGYYTQALALLRVVVEDISIVMNLSYHGEYAALEQVYDDAIAAGAPTPPKSIEPGQLRAALQKELGGQMAETVEDLKHLVAVLSLFARASIVVPRFLVGEDGRVSLKGFYTAEAFKTSAAYYTKALYYATEVIYVLFAEVTTPAWHERIRDGQSLLGMLQTRLGAEMAATLEVLMTQATAAAASENATDRAVVDASVGRPQPS